MAQWLKCLPHKFEKLSLNAQLYIKPERQSTSLYSQGLCCEMGGKTGDSLEDPEPARLLYTVANSKETPSQTRWEVRTDTLGHPTTSMCAPMLTHRHHTHTQEKQRKQNGRQTFKFRLRKFMLFKTKILYANII